MIRAAGIPMESFPRLPGQYTLAGVSLHNDAVPGIIYSPRGIGKAGIMLASVMFRGVHSDRNTHWYLRLKGYAEAKKVPPVD